MYCKFFRGGGGGFVFFLLFLSQVARETLLNALVRFTLLDASRHMEDKNVSCVNVLLTLALSEGNLLRESWGLVLRCISQLSRFEKGKKKNG